MKDHARTPNGSHSEPRATLVHTIPVDDMHTERIPSDDEVAVRLRTFEDAAPLVEVDLPGDTSGFEGVEWLTIDEAEDLVLGLVEAVALARRRPGGTLTTDERVGIVGMLSSLLTMLKRQVREDVESSPDGASYRLDLVDDAGEVVDSQEVSELGFRMAKLADRDPALIPALEMIVEHPEGARVLLDRLGVKS